MLEFFGEFVAAYPQLELGLQAVGISASALFVVRAGIWMLMSLVRRVSARRGKAIEKMQVEDLIHYLMVEFKEKDAGQLLDYLRDVVATQKTYPVGNLVKEVYALKQILPTSAEQLNANTGAIRFLADEKRREFDDLYAQLKTLNEKHTELTKVYKLLLDQQLAQGSKLDQVPGIKPAYGVTCR